MLIIKLNSIKLIKYIIKKIVQSKYVQLNTKFIYLLIGLIDWISYYN